MKDYWNREETDNHLALFTLQANVQKMIERKVTNAEETAYLKYINTYLDKFNQSVLKRLGSAYARKLTKTAEINQVVIIGKHAERKEALSYIAGEDFLPCFKDVQAIRCMCCNREDYQNCSAFNMGTSVGAMGTNIEKGCPFRIDEFD